MTEREKILFAREAFAAGLLRARELAKLPVTEFSRRAAREEAESAFPMIVTRPRVVESDGFLYRVKHGRFEMSRPGSDWVKVTFTNPTEIGKLAELLQNPTETVEEE